MAPNDGLRKEDLAQDPYKQFEKWFAEAGAAAHIGETNAVALATASPAGRPSNRMVLLRDFSRESGFVFYTNYDSRKGEELTANPWAAMLFYWPALHRQVRLEGRVQRVPAAVSDAYFAGRQRGSQISAAASPQSRVIPGRETLDARWVEVEREFAGREVTRPEQWGGCALHPTCFEFWQGRDYRFHDRLVYRARPEGGWIVERLAP